MQVQYRTGTPFPTRMMLTVLSVALLTACGGGGGGGGMSSMPPDAVRPVVVPPEDVDPPKDVEPPAFVNDPASPSQRDPADYTATGVKVGVLDMGFDNEPPLLHRVAVAAQLQGTIRPQDAVAGTHGSQVSRLIGGRDIGDEFPTGAASNFLLYQANLAKSLTGDVLGDSLNALADRGVKIVNNSWSISAAPENHLPNGANVMANSVLAQAFFPRMREAVLARGQLLIWANGNEGTDQPFLFAGAPYIDPALERGWITVVQLQDGHLVASSNACGLAANWCLGAQAPAGLSGTSYSAPLVTAAAAQVSQIFPWMDNSALRQT
ncbi:MAG: S8 family serine peptidase, partial [Burkholderiaceae bacterium]|nr:S8 family serine peptidase [Burkholderiaceae bacterium]